MREAKIVVDMIQGELLPHAVCTLAERADPSADRGHLLADGQVEALHERRGDLPATARQHLLDRLKRAEHDAVADADQTPPAYGLDDLRREQLRQGLLTLCQPQFVKFLPHLHDWLTANSACIIAGAMTQHGHQNTQQSVANIAQGLAMALSLRPQSRIHAVAVSVPLHPDSRPMVK